jgi:hypothetical protein
MDAKVIKRFRDKNSKKVYSSGDKYQGSKERVEFLQNKGFLEKPLQKDPSLLDGNVGEVTAVITADLGKEELEKLLQEETNDKNRKGVIEHIEGLLAQ